MAEVRKDNRGRKLETGERYDSKNNRYMFQKMIDGERISITAHTLNDLRKKKNEILCRLDKGGKINSSKAKMTLNAYFDYWLETFAKSGRKATTCTNYKSYYSTYIKNTIGKKQIAKITKADCQRIINEMIEDGKKHSTMANLKSYSAGADVKIVSQILGHASTSVTMDVYTHLTEDKKRQQEEVVQTIKIS